MRQQEKEERIRHLLQRYYEGVSTVDEEKEVLMLLKSLQPLPPEFSADIALLSLINEAQTESIDAVVVPSDLEMRIRKSLRISRRLALRRRVLMWSSAAVAALLITVGFIDIGRYDVDLSSKEIAMSEADSSRNIAMSVSLADESAASATEQEQKTEILKDESSAKESSRSFIRRDRGSVSRKMISTQERTSTKLSAEDLATLSAGISAVSDAAFQIASQRVNIGEEIAHVTSQLESQYVNMRDEMACAKLESVIEYAKLYDEVKSKSSESNQCESNPLIP